MSTTEDKVSVQKYRWKEKKRFENYSDADKLRKFFLEEGYVVKVKRCGPEGTRFKVLTGELINKKNKKNKRKNNQEKK